MMVQLLSATPYPFAGASLTVTDTNGLGTGSFLPGNTTNATNLPITTCGPRNRSYVEQLSGINPFFVGGNSYRSFIGAGWYPQVNYHGDVTFFACGVIANGDGTPLGDVCYCNQLTLSPAQPLDVVPGDTATTSDASAKAAILYDYGLRLLYVADESSLIKTYIYDLTGVCVATQSHEVIQGANLLTLPTSLPWGLYVLGIRDWDGSLMVLKLMVK